MTAFLNSAYPSALYFVISMAVALGLWVQIVLLRKNNGKYPNSSLFSVLSTFDSIWFIVSVVAFFGLDFVGFGKVAPVFYVAYTILGFFYASRTMEYEKMPPMRPEDLTFSPKYLDFVQSFALVFFVVCALLLVALFVPVPFLSTSR